MSHSCYRVETICHPNISYVTTQLYGTSTCGCNNNTIFFKKTYFNVSYRRCMPHTLAWRRSGLDHACQSGNMAILLTSLLFVFEISFLPKYRVNYDITTRQCNRLYMTRPRTTFSSNLPNNNFANIWNEFDQIYKNTNQKTRLRNFYVNNSYTLI